MDRRRLSHLRKRILDFTRDARLAEDIGLPSEETEALRKIDTFLCDLKVSFFRPLSSALMRHRKYLAERIFIDRHHRGVDWVSMKM